MRKIKVPVEMYEFVCILFFEVDLEQTDGRSEARSLLKWNLENKCDLLYHSKTRFRRKIVTDEYL